MSTITDKLKQLDEKMNQQPKLPNDERPIYNQICERLQRANADKRRAEKRGDAKLLAKAERAIARNKQARETFLAPYVAPLWAPERIIATFENRWSGPGVAGNHHQACEMILDYKDVSGPQYRTVRVLKDEGGPPAIARSAPSSMGVAWFAINEQIERGKIIVLDALPSATGRVEITPSKELS